MSFEANLASGPHPGSGAGPRLRARWHGSSVVGCVRKNNEDSLTAGVLDQGEFVGGDTSVNESATIEGASGLSRPGVVLAVADGMGGASAGEVASQMAVSILGSELPRRVGADLAPAADGNAICDMFVRVVEFANERIRENGAQDSDRRGMGTTLTAMWMYDDFAQMAHVGDSRAYLFRKGKLARLTKDQSLVEKLLEDKIISPEEAEAMEMTRNIILQALGSEEELDVAHPTSDLRAGDTLLLCTDGLTTVVSDEQIEEILRQGGDLEELCGRLTASAEGGGGPDNITVLLCSLENEHESRD